MNRALTSFIVELGLLFAQLYIMFTGFTTDNEIVEIICYCTIVIVAIIEWRVHSIRKLLSLTTGKLL
jgi:hypothetical protein